jgi:HEAT repeat protein
MVGNAAAVPALAKCLTSDEVLVCDEAARALANIPGKEAEDVLKRNNAIVSAQLAKDALTARAAKAEIPKNDGLERQPIEVPNKNQSEWSNMEKVQVLSDLTARTEGSRINRQQPQQRGTRRQQTAGAGAGRNNPYIPLALEAAKSSDETLRNAGLLALGALGGEDEVPFLLEHARSGANKELAKAALSRMRGQRIDNFLLEALKSEKDNDKFNILADVLNRRFNSAMRPILLDRAKADGIPNRLQLLQWAEPISNKADVGSFVKTWVLISDRGQKDQAEQAVARLSKGDASVAMQALGNWDTPEGLSLLGRISDASILDKIRQSKNAVHAFRTWTNAVVADDLMKIVRDEESSETDRIAALRAYIRVMSLPDDQIGIKISDADKVKKLAEAYECAKRDEEKRLVIERVGQIRTVESLRFVLKYFDEPQLQERVCESILDLAHQVDLKRSAMDEFTAALDKVLAVAKRNDFRERANRYKSQR